MLQSFPPIVDKECRVLILGTMPSVRSLEKQEYYGHPQNHFWRIIYGLFDKEVGVEYQKKKAFLLKHQIALWDVLAFCKREGSSDSNIKNPVANDIPGLLLRYPGIRAIFCDSIKAEELFNRFARDQISSDISYHRLPSPSPARTMKWQDKLEEWRIVLNYLNYKD
ncbi:MAG TPA: DNA-deoxyinosine glycosylase [Bacillota bacterium]|nr:DNA-deoxyinosine glycosylase [Bacillota bacterium]